MSRVLFVCWNNCLSSGEWSKKVDDRFGQIELLKHWRQLKDGILYETKRNRLKCFIVRPHLTIRSFYFCRLSMSFDSLIAMGFYGSILSLLSIVLHLNKPDFHSSTKSNPFQMTFESIGCQMFHLFLHSSNAKLWSNAIILSNLSVNGFFSVDLNHLHTTENNDWTIWKQKKTAQNSHKQNSFGNRSFVSTEIRSTATTSALFVYCSCQL